MKDETIELKLPERCAVLVYASQEHPGDWVIKVNIQAVDVETGGLGDFSTTWVGGPPSRDDVASAVANMLVHEIREQLGCNPHGLPDVDGPRGVDDHQRDHRGEQEQLPELADLALGEAPQKKPDDAEYDWDVSDDHDETVADPEEIAGRMFRP